MKLEFQTNWLRVLVELFPNAPRIRRHRVTAAGQDPQLHRLLRRRIGRELRQSESEAGS